MLANSGEQALCATDAGHREGGIFSEGEEGADGREVEAAAGRGGVHLDALHDDPHKTPSTQKHEQRVRRSVPPTHTQPLTRKSMSETKSADSRDGNPRKRAP